LGGTWSSGNTGTATVNATGDVTAIAAGTTNIIYTLPEGCSAVREFTVNPLPADISGMLSVCKDANTTLGNTSTGGVWESGSLAVGTIDATSGVVSGLSQGTTIITYTLPTTCLTTAVVTVNPLPNPITGALNVCFGLTTALSNSTTGGVWSSASNSIAPVNSSGVVTGAGVGNTHISYTLPTTCYAVASVVVNGLPADISGASSICPGSTTIYTDATINGTWGSDNDAVGIIDATGMLSAVSTGSVNVSYTLPNGCLKTTNV
jgi:trimeric autotransporter adhesin